MLFPASSATRLRQFNWGPGLFIIVYHLLLLVGIPLYSMFYSIPWGLVWVSMALMYITGLSVTVGYHRLYAHTTYKTRPVVEAVLMFFGTMATQGSALRWSFDHRCHHAFVDTDRDPYSISKGFWYAHFMWLFEKPQEIDSKVVADLNRKPLLVFQHRYYGILVMALNILAFLVLGWAFNDYLGAFLFGWLGRMFVLHHLTWFINSLAHTWGARTFCKELSAVDNYVIALLTFGEGYHNYHHTFANDYRNGIRWFHFDPTKWIIWTLSKCGLTTQLKRVQSVQIEERILSEHRAILLEKVAEKMPSQIQEWEKKISTVIDGIVEKLREVKQVKETYAALKKKKESRDALREIKSRMRLLKKSLREGSREWTSLAQHLNKNVLFND
jgi:stearoyl-CoA desaturase (Delta-9 desaturase)